MKTNLAVLGVASDANKSVKKIKSHKLKFVEEDISDEDMSKGVDDESKSSGVVEKLMKEAAIKKPPTFRFSSEQVFCFLHEVLGGGRWMRMDGYFFDTSTYQVLKDCFFHNLL